MSLNTDDMDIAIAGTVPKYVNRVKLFKKQLVICFSAVVWKLSRGVVVTKCREITLFCYFVNLRLWRVEYRVYSYVSAKY